VSVCVHAFPSEQVVPFARGDASHASVVSLQTPTLHWLVCAEQSRAGPAVHVPLWHVSFTEQNRPSLQLVPFGAGGFEQVPVPGLQVPATWHWSLAEQITGLEPVQVPDWQVSVWVHASPSEQAVPFGAVGFEQVPVPGLQVPATWH
jgi:hypothetical protein